MPNDDRILIKDLLLRGIIGLNDWEREKKQDILINMTLFADLRAAGESDDIADSLNYRTITKAVITHVEEGSEYISSGCGTGAHRGGARRAPRDRSSREAGGSALRGFGGCRNRAHPRRLPGRVKPHGSGVYHAWLERRT
jgi:hypothetical protein